MPLIFNRLQANGHFMTPAIDQLRSSDEPKDLAIAANLMYDPRVGKPREEILRSLYDARKAEVSVVERLQKTQVQYFKELIRIAKEPDFQKSHNRENIAYGGAESADFRADTKLVRLLDLYGLHDIFRNARDTHWVTSTGRQVFEFYPSDERADSRDVVVWLNHRLDGDDARAEEFVGAVLELLNDRLENGQAWHPTWVGLWDELHDFLHRETADRWMERLGIGGLTGGNHWIVLLVYAVEYADPVFRPTIIDCAWSPNHFPSPPDVPPSVGGHPLDLGSSRNELPREFIHTQIRHLPEHFRAASRLRKRTGRGSPDDLHHPREVHRQLLGKRYKLLSNHWMPRGGC
jgi:hypothetical protein